MTLFGRKNKDNKEGKTEKVSNRRTFRLDKIKAITTKSYAVAKKRKWLTLMIAAAIVAYLVIFKGGSGAGILNIVKGLF